jgi:hypothetical protein
LSQGTYGQIFKVFRERGISPFHGFISFAFASMKNEVDVFGHSDIILSLQDHEWDDKKIENVKSIIRMLVILRCTDLNVLYVAAPFITTADNATLGRLRVALEFLTNDTPGIASPYLCASDSIQSNGRILNAMIHRSAHLGFRPVVKALYIFYRKAVEIKRVREHLRVPEELLTTIVTSEVNFERESMIQLSLTIRRHHESSKLVGIAEQSTTMSTTTDKPI